MKFTIAKRMNKLIFARMHFLISLPRPTDTAESELKNDCSKIGNSQTKIDIKYYQSLYDILQEVNDNVVLFEGIHFDLNDSIENVSSYL